jgi:transcriptional regulator with PAS, ATPase and Fis domain
MIGSSNSLHEIKLSLARMAASNCTVLITGETGTGKELAAEYIHRNSRRNHRPFTCVNCAAIADSLFENELFGHSRGAFTGADAAQDGLLAAANGGTVFLDEIGDMSLAAQAKILRVLENKEVCRVGGTCRIQLDIRFLAATNQDLEEMVTTGRFRKDLFFRLNVAPIHLPALRDRKEDVPLLLEHYATEFRPGTKSGPMRFSDECLRLLIQYDWPGNIRELKNLVEFLSVAEIPSPIQPENLPPKFRSAARNCATEQEQERNALIAALNWAKGNKTAAARRLQWSRMTLYRKLIKHQLFLRDLARPEVGVTAM